MRQSFKKYILFLLASFYGMITGMQKGPGELLKIIQQSDDISHINTESLLNTINKNGENAFHLACKQGDIKSIKKMCFGNKQSDLNNLLFSRDSYGYLAIHKAAENDQAAAITSLLIAQLNNGGHSWDLISNHSNYSGSSPLHLAAMQGHLSTVKELIDSTLHKNLKELLFMEKHSHYTALYLAAANGHAEIIEILLKAANDSALDLASMCDSLGMTPIHRTIQKMSKDFTKVHADVLNIFIQTLGFDILHVKNHYGTTALQYAIERNNKNIYDYLFEKFKQQKPNGIEKLNFEYIFPQELVEHIKQILAKPLATKFKQRLLNHKYQQREDHKNKEILETIDLGALPNKTLHYHDGTYAIVPDIGYDYAMWDEGSKEKKLFHGTRNNETLTLVLCSEKPEQPKINVYFPLKECQEKNKINLDIYLDNDHRAFWFSSASKHHVLSHDGTWLAICTSQHNNNINFFNFNSRKFEAHASLNGSITALCAAHNSPLFLACSDNEIALITPDIILALNKYFVDPGILGAEFSTDDSQLFYYTKNNIRLWTLCKNASNGNRYELSSTRRIGLCSIRKAFFSPDGKKIVVALENGELISCECPFDFKHPTTWRWKDVAQADEQAPCILWSSDSSLLFSLDPTNHNNATICNFIIRKPTTGRFLMAYNFHPNNPTAMGLTKDERTVVFMHPDNTVSLLDLYNDSEIKDINFIEKKASTYQLCELLQVCKENNVDQNDSVKWTHDKNASTFIGAMQNCIANFRKKI